jgi:hypothetical protein
LLPVIVARTMAPVGFADKKSVLPPTADQLLSRLRFTKKGKVPT